MAVGAHADDLEINVGGTLLKYRDLGYEVAYVMATNNMSGRIAERQPDGSLTFFREDPEAHMARRKRECAAASAMLGVEPIHLDYPQRHYFAHGQVIEAGYGAAVPSSVPLEVPTILTACENPNAIRKMADAILDWDPEIILTHGVAQRNIEHFAVCLLVTNAFWNAAERGYAGGLLQWREAMTLHGDHNFRWETHVDCEGYLDRKMRLIGAHASQMPAADEPDHGHRQLGAWRGCLSGCEMAEFFTWVRRPVRAGSKITGSFSPIHGELTAELIQNSR